MDKNPCVFIVSEDGSDANWLGTVRSLGSMGIKTIRLSPRSWYSSKYCSTIISPHIATEPRDYLRFLMSLGKKMMERYSCKNILLPSNDRGLILISKNKEMLEDYFEPVVPDWVTTDVIIDKSKTYKFADSEKIHIPKTFYPKNVSEIDYIAEMVHYPCLIKPIYSHIFTKRFGIKLIKVRTRNMLLNTYKTLHHQGYESIITEEIAGEDDQIYMLTTCFNRNSEPLAIFTSRKIRQYPPQFGEGSFIESVWEPRIVDIGVYLLKKLRFYGVAMIEFKKNQETGEFKLLEINGRSHSQNHLATACGLNLPYILYKDVIGESKKPIDRFSCQFQVGVKWLHITKDFLSFLRKHKKGEIAIKDWLHSIIIGKKDLAILSLDDFSPFLSELKRSISSIGSKIN